MDAVKESSEQKQRSGSSLSAAAAAIQLHPTGFWLRGGTRQRRSESVALYLHLNIVIDHRWSRPRATAPTALKLPEMVAAKISAAGVSSRRPGVTFLTHVLKLSARNV